LRQHIRRVRRQLLLRQNFAQSFLKFFAIGKKRGAKKIALPPTFAALGNLVKMARKVFAGNIHFQRRF
jgi:hypothetical protein